MNIVLTGSVAYDYLMTFPGYFKEQILPERLASISLSFLVDSMSRQRGGTAPNIAYNLALLGRRSRVMATVGEDFAEYRQFLESVGVDTALMEVVPGKFTASFFATTDKDNAQIASFYPGAMADAAIQKLAAVTPRPDLVVISPNDPLAMKSFAAECRELGIPYLYDPSQQVLRLEGEELARDLECAHFLFVNDYEFGLICKKTGMTRTEILNHVDILVVTCGKDGAYIYADGQEILIPIFPTGQIVDPTGVGDAFRGGFLTGYSHGWDWKLCGEAGALAAAYCLEQLGPQGHFYTPQAFITRFRTQFDDGGKLDQLLQRAEA
ncbi:MAG: carbohydrate kinase family protein [Chloroflexota bacterium]